MQTEAIAALLNEAAEAVILPRFRALGEGQIDEKRPGDFVTVADREAEEFLTQRLSAACPGAVVVGEESAYADPAILAGLANAEHAFVIDPIDGTGNFVRGDERFGVMLAELRAGVTTRGWIWQPTAGRSYTAERGAGVCLNGVPITRVRHERLPLAAASRRALHGYDGDGRFSPAVPSSFSCAFDYPRLLHGEVDFLYWTSNKPWDHLAGSLMLTELGGVSRTPDGVSYSALSPSGSLLVAGDAATWLLAQEHWPPPA